MKITAKAKHIRMSPRKVRLVVDAVRGKNVIEAMDALKFMNKLATNPVTKLINSAIANAHHNYEIEKDNLKIDEIRVDEGATLKRWMPRAFGRATPIRKRTSHISLVLGEIKDSGEKEGKKQDIEDPIKIAEGAGKTLKSQKKESQKKQKSHEDELNKKKETEEPIKKIVDPRGEGRGGHAKIEGKSHDKGFISKVFRRKSG